MQPRECSENGKDIKSAIEKQRLNAIFLWVNFNPPTSLDSRNLVKITHNDDLSWALAKIAYE